MSKNLWVDTMKTSFQITLNTMKLASIYEDNGNKKLIKFKDFANAVISNETDEVEIKNMICNFLESDKNRELLISGFFITDKEKKIKMRGPIFANENSGSIILKINENQDGKVITRSIRFGLFDHYLRETGNKYLVHQDAALSYFINSIIIYLEKNNFKNSNDTPKILKANPLINVNDPFAENGFVRVKKIGTTIASNSMVKKIVNESGYKDQIGTLVNCFLSLKEEDLERIKLATHDITKSSDNIDKKITTLVDEFISISSKASDQINTVENFDYVEDEV